MSGHFTTFGSGPSLDLIVTDQTGILLEGTYGGRIINGLIGTDGGDSHSTFNVDGGSLASLFPSDPFSGRMTNSLFGITPLFNQDTFSQNFDGDIDGIISAVPEPPTLVLAGTGSLIGLVCACYEGGKGGQEG